jgi:hypothetical protein
MTWRGEQKEMHRLLKIQEQEWDEEADAELKKRPEYAPSFPAKTVLWL